MIDPEIPKMLFWASSLVFALQALVFKYADAKKVPAGKHECLTYAVVSALCAAAAWLL